MWQTLDSPDRHALEPARRAEVKLTEVGRCPLTVGNASPWATGQSGRKGRQCWEHRLAWLWTQCDQLPRVPVPMAMTPSWWTVPSNHKPKPPCLKWCLSRSLVTAMRQAVNIGSCCPYNEVSVSLWDPSGGLEPAKGSSLGDCEFSWMRRKISFEKFIINAYI